MNIIDEIMSHDAAKWVNSQVDGLPDRAKFRAFNSIRFLKWASCIHSQDMHIPACFCATHATEEAVAAFISIAKETGYEDATDINIKSHQDKAIIALLVQEIRNILVEEDKISLAYRPDDNAVAIRRGDSGEYTYYIASTNLIYFRDAEGNPVADFTEKFAKRFEDVDGLKKEVKNNQEARNKLIYANSEGYPSGADVPEQLLSRECQISLGLIWASVDLYKNKSTKSVIIEQALKTAKILIEELNSKKVGGGGRI